MTSVDKGSTQPAQLHSVRPRSNSPLSEIAELPSEPITIRTSKKWVLPPRPKPGRKPSVAKHGKRAKKPKKEKKEKDATKEPAKKEAKKKRSRKPSGISGSPGGAPAAGQTSPAGSVAMTSSSAASAASAAGAAGAASSSQPGGVAPGANGTANTTASAPASTYIEVEASAMQNPMKQQILKINEENYYLKLEVIKLVTDLRNLRRAVPRQARKRAHDDDINELIVSLIDLNHDEAEAKRQKNGQLSQQAAAAVASAVEGAPEVGAGANATATATATAIATASNHVSEGSLAAAGRAAKSNSPQPLAMALSGTANTTISEDVDGLLNLASPTVSEDEDLTSTVSTTPSTMLTSIKTNETVDSLSGTTVASSSPPFRLLDIPEVTGVGNKTSESFLFNGPASLVDEATFGTELISGEFSEGVTSNDYYEFDGVDDMEMEFDNFVNGRI